MASHFVKLAVLTLLVGCVITQEAIHLVPSFRLPFNLPQGATQYFALTVSENNNVVYSYVQCTTGDLATFTNEFTLRARLNVLPTPTEYETRALNGEIVQESFATKEVLIPANVASIGTWNFAVQNTFTSALDCSILAFANPLIVPRINTQLNVTLLAPAWQYFNVPVPHDQILTVISTHPRVEFLTYELSYNFLDGTYPLLSEPGLLPDVYGIQGTEVAELIIPNDEVDKNFFLSSYVLFNGVPVNVPINYQLFFNLATERVLAPGANFEDTVLPLESDYFKVSVNGSGIALFISIQSDYYLEPLISYIQYPTLKEHLDLFAEFLGNSDGDDLNNGTHSFDYRAVLSSKNVKEGDYHVRVANFRAGNVTYAISYDLVDEMEIQWNQEISAVLSAGRSDSYLVAVNRGDVMLNIVTQSNADFVILAQNDAYPSDFDTVTFIEDTWVDPQTNRVNKHLIVDIPEDGNLVGTWHILVQHKRDQLNQDLEYSIAVFGTTERSLDEYSLTSGSLPRGAFDYFKLEVPESDIFNLYIVIEGTPSAVDAIIQFRDRPTTRENNNDILKQSSFLSSEFSITELLVKSNFLEEGVWRLRLANNVPFNDEDAPQGPIQYAMRSHYAELTPLEVGVDTSVTLAGNRIAFFRVPVVSAANPFTLTITPADVQVLHRYGNFPLISANDPVSQINIFNDTMTITISPENLSVGNHFFRVQANSLLRNVDVRASFVVNQQVPTAAQPTTVYNPPRTDAPTSENITPTQRDGLNGYQVALVVIIVVFFVIFVGLLSVVIMQRNALKRARGDAPKTSMEYTLLEK